MATLGQPMATEKQKGKGKAYLADKMVSDVFCCCREGCALWPKLVSLEVEQKGGNGGW
jgi:hypothetical protein